MHFTALENARRFFEVYATRKKEGDLIDIGALNVNGSIKDICPSHLKYVGVDFTAGPGVDVILDDPYRLPFDDATCDFVVTSSCLEHSEFFWLLFLEALRITKDDGLIYINAPSNAAFHRYPVDCWRFYPDSGSALAKWGNHNGFDCELLESYISNQRKGRVNDFVAIFARNREKCLIYTDRIINHFEDFSNGMTNISKDVFNLEWETEDQRKYPYKERVKRLRRKVKAKIKSVFVD